ncbi:hypothetical protein [Aeromonas phage 85AhydR10PP]|nr:hypothetical protein [Aeromonas phage 85AhydR10PP]
MSAFKITMKQEQIAQCFEVIKAHSGDASAARMVAHHRALVDRLNAEIVTMKQVISVQTFGPAVVVSTGCKGEWMIVAGGLDATGAVVKGSRIGGISSKRNAEKLARIINKMA